MDFIQPFVKQFHDIKGARMGERKKNFNILLNELKKHSFTTEQLSTLDQMIIPQNILEESFKLITLIELRHKDYLFQVLLGENLRLIGRLMKAKWFFKEAFLDMQAAYLVDVIFEEVSPITRGRIINKLAQNLENEDLALAFFSAISEKYGLASAKNLLPNCKVDFIKDTVTNFDIILTHKQLTKIAKKDITFVEFYFDKYKKGHFPCSLIDYTEMFHYLAATDFEYFVKISDKLEFCPKMNHKVTPRYYNMKKDEILSKPEKYKTLLHYPLLRKVLKEDFRVFYKNSFPKSIGEFNTDNSLRYINHFKKDVQYELLVSTFLAVYKVDISKYPNLVTENYLEIMPMPERVEKAKSKFDDDTWICYLDIKDSLPMIKERIKLYSDRSARSNYLNYLVTTCKVNDDKDALLDVLRYVTTRHKNEDSGNRTSFLLTLDEKFKVEKLPCDHWIEINKLLRLFKLNCEYFYEMSTFLSKYVLMLYNNDKITEEALTLYTQELSGYYSWHIRSFKDIPKYNKHYLSHLPKIVGQTFKDVQLMNGYITFLDAMSEWNKKYYNDQIDPFSYTEMIEYILDHYEKNPNEDPLHVFNVLMLQTTTRTELKNKVEVQFWNKLGKFAYASQPALLHILKCETHKFFEHIDQVLKTNLSDVILQARFYSHMGMQQKITDFYLNQLKNEETREDAIKMLSHILHTEDYLKLMDEYIPKKYTIDLENEDQVIFKCQRAFVDSLRHLDRYSLTLPILQEFCQGDYLSHSVKSLYCIVKYTCAKKTQDLLNVLLQRATSVRKNGIFLMVHMRKMDVAYDTLKRCGETEKNSSLKKFLFKWAFKYFCANQTPKFWELVKINAQFINKQDEEAYQYFFRLRSVPLKYIFEFVPFAWHSVLESTNKRVLCKKFEIIGFIDKEIMALMTDEFCTTILKEHLFSADNQRHEIQEFAYMYVTKGDGYENLDVVCELLKQFVKKHWAGYENYKNRQTARAFITSLCDNFVINNKTALFNKFAEHWQGVMAVNDAYEEHLILQMSHLYMSVDCEDEYRIRYFAVKTIEFYIENVTTYGTTITHVFANVLAGVLGKYFAKFDGTLEEKEFIFLVALLNANKSANAFALLLELLPKQISSCPDIEMQHKFILSEIAQCGELWIKVLYNLYLNNLET